MAKLPLLLTAVAIAIASPARAAELPKPAAIRFEPGEVTLLPGPYQHALELDAKVLLSMEPDRLLAWYRKEAGLAPKAEVYEGWENRGIAGHSLGHYLSACARMYAATGDEKFRERVEKIVADLDECQKAAGDGFLGAMPNGRRVFAEVSRGDIRSQGFDLNGSWVPWYNLHKLFAGLIDANRYCGNETAKTVVARLGDWALQTTKNLTPEQWQRMLACEHGGMNESLADLAALTGNQAYLELAQKFYHQRILDPLAEGRDDLGGKHANTQIPKAIGAARIYELTGDQKFARISDFFWHTVVANHTYVNGGNSDGESFAAPGRLNDRLGANTAETCNTYNMLKLTASLFTREPRGEYAEYMERALWNHILASRHPESGRVCYYLTLRPGASRVYMGDFDFTCCNGSGMENPVRTADYIYFHGDKQLWVNQFIPSVAKWKSAGVILRQETEFPNEPTSRFKFECASPTKFTLHLRHPSWVAGPLSLTLNGEKLAMVSSPGGFASIDREWKDGDVLEVELPMSLRTETMPDNLARIAVFNGPILLAGNLSAIAEDAEGAQPKARDDGPVPEPVTELVPELVPVLVTDDRPVAQWVKPNADRKLEFQTASVGRPRDVPLLPFYAAHDMPATVYWASFDEAKWHVRQAEYELERRRVAELEARTVDLFPIGEQQPEMDHKVDGEKTDKGDFNGRKFRHAWDGGWFSCEVTVPDEGAAELIVDYWGSETGAREFDVQVEGKTIATTRLRMDAPNRFWEESYPLPDDLIAGKKKITVRFQAKPNNYAGGVFGIRVVRPK